MWWQAELLYYSYCLSGMQGTLSALVADTGTEELPFSCGSISVSNYSNYCRIEPLLCLNKPGSIMEWACRKGPAEETVLVVDPDSVFVRSVPDPGPIADGEAYSEEHDYMSLSIPGNLEVVKRHCRFEHQWRIQPIGIYILTNRATLAELSRLWFIKSVEIATDLHSRKALGGTGWLSDMWGYAIASAELGIHHHVGRLSQVTGSDSLECAITHYCFPLMVNNTRWRADGNDPILWSKWDYKIWDIPPTSDGTTAEGIHLLRLLGEIARSYKKGWSPWPNDRR